MNILKKQVYMEAEYSTVYDNLTLTTLVFINSNYYSFVNINFTLDQGLITIFETPFKAVLGTLSATSLILSLLIQLLQELPSIMIS